MGCEERAHSRVTSAGGLSAPPAQRFLEPMAKPLSYPEDIFRQMKWASDG